jgi:hypothetical protein
MENPAASTVVKHVVGYTKYGIVQKAMDWAVVEEVKRLPLLENIT